MAWSNGLTLVFRGSNNPDPTTMGYVEQAVATLIALPTPLQEGDSIIYGGGTIEGARRQRWSIEIDCLGFYVMAASADAAFQDYGDFLNLKMNIFSKTYKWIYAAYEIAGGGVIKRAGIDGTNSFWKQTTDTPAGYLPMLVELDGDMQPESVPDMARVNLSFTVQGRSLI